MLHAHSHNTAAHTPNQQQDKAQLMECYGKRKTYLHLMHLADKKTKPLIAFRGVEVQPVHTTYKDSIILTSPVARREAGGELEAS